jgi:hypothetical protein
MVIRRSQPSRTNLSAAERDSRSRLLQQLSSGKGFIRGTLTIRERACGKPNCKCTRGEKHASLYIVMGIEGKYKQVCVPRSLEADVRNWVEQYQRVQELIEEISLSYWAKIQKREE